MGEAKRKSKHVGAIEGTRFDELQRQFDRLGIDTTSPGFYDDPRYVQHESEERHFLEAYAEWVMHRPRTPDYDAMVRDVTGKLADILEARIVRHNWNGGCIAVCNILTRILDRLGIWNFPMAGSVSIYALGESRHFAIVDDNEGAGFDTGHMWIVAPPYNVIDLTLHFQRWQGDFFQRQIPKQILATGSSTKARAQDVVAPEVRRRHRPDPELHFRLFQDQKRVLDKFRTKKVVWNSADIRYVPAGVRVPKEPLEGVNTDERQGVSAIRIWREDVAPVFALRP